MPTLAGRCDSNEKGRRPFRRRKGPGCVLIPVREDGGFTLLELVVALALLGLMSLVAYSSFRVALNSYEKASRKIEQDARQRVLQDLLKRQIGSLFPMHPTGSFLQEDASQAGNGTTDPTASVAPLFYGTADSVTFVTVAPLSISDHPGLSVVRYGLAEDEYGRNYLGAMEVRYTGLGSFQQMMDIPRGKPLAIVDHVQTLKFDYFGHDADSDTEGWFDSWDASDRLTLPRAIRIEFDGRAILVEVNVDSNANAPQGLQRLQFLQRVRQLRGNIGGVK